MAKYEFGVTMTCEGCSNAVNRVLSRIEGVKSIDISLADQRVTVTTDDSVTQDQLHDKIAKTGKPITSEKKLE